jgi:uncharacterized protein
MQISGEGEATPPMPFALARATAPARPYRSEEVTFANGQVTLSGTVFTPAAGRPRGAVVFVHGSSLNLRDGYRFHADHFARAGFVTLTYDKRGSGRSTGSYQAATLDDLVGDAIAAVQMLRSRPGVDSSRVGVWGLSQGGTLVPLVAQRAPVAFVIAVSGPGVSFGETAAWQDSVGLVRRGFAVADAAAAASIHRRLTEWMRTGEGDAEITALLARTAELPWRRHTGIPRQPPTAAERHGWYWATRPLDPVEWWRAVRVPTLVLFGEADPLLPARRSADLITAALRAAGNDDARVVVFPGADHMLRTSARAAGGGWAWPRAAPGYQDTVTAWLARMAR